MVLKMKAWWIPDAESILNYFNYLECVVWVAVLLLLLFFF